MWRQSVPRYIEKVVNSNEEEEKKRYEGRCQCLVKVIRPLNAADDCGHIDVEDRKPKIIYQIAIRRREMNVKDRGQGTQCLNKDE